MNDEKANLVPTSPVEWEEAFESSSSNVTLQQCHRLLEVAHLRYLLRILPANSSVLEAGCGPGKYVYAFAFMGHKCIGLDFSYKILLQARKRAVDLPKLRARTDWIHGTILNLPIGPEMLDCHASFGVLEHFTKPQQKAILSEAYRVLNQVVFYICMCPTSGQLGPFGVKFAIGFAEWRLHILCGKGISVDRYC